MVSTTLFVFSGTASSWIFNISASLMVAKREFTPAFLFCLDHALFTPQGIMLNYSEVENQSDCLKHQDH